MTKNYKKIYNKNQDGFSLIEVMIVILIGGLLMAGAFGGLKLYRDAQISRTDSKLATIDQNLEMYFTRIGEYPKDLTELIEGPRNPALRRKWAESSLKPADITDSWSHEFVYELRPKGSRPPYELYSTGSDGNAKIYSPASKD